MTELSMPELYCIIGYDSLFDGTLTVEWEQWDKGMGFTLAMSEHGTFVPIVTVLESYDGLESINQSIEMPLPQWAVAFREDSYVETP